MIFIFKVVKLSSLWCYKIENLKENTLTGISYEQTTVTKNCSEKNQVAYKMEGS